MIVEGYIAPGSVTDEQYRNALNDREALGLCKICGQASGQAALAGVCGYCVLREWT